MSFSTTAANVADNNKKVLDKRFKPIRGKCFGDKGYISKHFEYFCQKGIQLITRARKNMKNKFMGHYDKIMLQRQGIIESVNDILITVFDIDHTGRRSPANALIHILGAVAACSFYEDKPRVFNPGNIQY